jgi:hypothetical protein
MIDTSKNPLEEIHRVVAERKADRENSIMIPDRSWWDNRADIRSYCLDTFGYEPTEMKPHHQRSSIYRTRLVFRRKADVTMFALRYTGDFQIEGKA